MRVVLILATLLLANFGQASTFIVQNTNDSGTGSLRSEISNALDGDTVRFNPSIISNGSATITLASEIAFSKSLTIIGVYNSVDTLYISGNNTNRIFGITNTTILVLDSMVVIDGNGVGATNSGNGGAIFLQNIDSLIIRNSTFRNNSSHVSIGNGGGIYSEHTGSIYAEIQNSLISNNVAALNGGGIMFFSHYSSILIENSNIRNNYALSSGGLGYFADSAELIVNSSTFNDNNADQAAGIMGYVPSNISNPYSKITVNHSTFFNNVATNYCGGIVSSCDSSLFQISNSTFKDNFSQDTTFFESSGVMAAINSANSFNMHANLIVGNSIFENSKINLGGFMPQSNGYNIFTYNPGGSISTDLINISSSEINLAPLNYNGASTQTMVPGFGSSAIDSGNPLDFSDAQNQSIIGIRDIGAAESNYCVHELNESLCFGDSIVINGTIYNATNLTGVELFPGNGPNNCDSVVTVDLTITAPIDLSTNLNGMSISSNQAGATYQWIECNGNTEIPGATDSTFAAISNGDYAVIVTVGNCSDTSECVTVSNVGLEDFTNVDFSIYPNPTTGETTIILKAFETNSTIDVYNSIGQPILNQMVESSTTTIDISGYDSGIYFVKIHTGATTIIQKVIKQ